jgi:dienelactone hydrolase
VKRSGAQRSTSSGEYMRVEAVRPPKRLALLSASVARGVPHSAAEREVTFKTSDGWKIVGMLHIPKSESKVPGVVLVHGSRHEADAYGQVSTPGLPQTLSQHGVATLRIDIRGRGASRGPRGFHSMTPAQREAVRLDVEAAIGFLGSLEAVKKSRIGIVAEQDSANAATIAGATDRRVGAFILISGSLGKAAKDAIRATAAPILCLVSKEDGRGFRDMTDAYLSSRSNRSRLRVFEGLALGTTMFSTWRNEFPDEQPLEEEAGVWLAERLNAQRRARI